MFSNLFLFCLKGCSDTLIAISYIILRLIIRLNLETILDP